MSSRQKGNRREVQCARLYEEAGYMVERATSGGYRSEDFYDLFDHLAFDPYAAELRCVQVKSNRAAGIEEWMQRAILFADIGHVHVEYAVCYDREGWRLVAPRFDDDGLTAETRFDGRDRDGAMGEALVEYLRGEGVRVGSESEIVGGQADE